MTALSASRLLAWLAIAVTLSFSTAEGSEDVHTPRSRKPEYQCKHPDYHIHMLSRSPLVIYIENFITPKERDHLLRVTNGTFTRSMVTGDNETAHTIHSIRTSSSTNVPSDPVARCIEARALEFQSLSLPRDHAENLQLVRYRPGEQYKFHTDWFGDYFSPHAAGADQGGNRISSFFAYVSVTDDIAGGGTNFPMLDPPRDSTWCHLIDCDEPWENGVTFRPVELNAVYWSNVRDDPDSTGDPRVLHAGLPVVSGEKIGMNIWTREGKVAGKWPDVD